MSDRFSTGSQLLWTSRKRQRLVRVVTAMAASPGLYLCQILSGLRGEEGAYRMVPEASLAVLP